MMTNRLSPARVRFAPSPTGSIHLGSARTALFNYLLARQTGGQFILRIEDTDRKRLVEGAEQEIYEGLHWMGLQWDEGPDIGGPCEPYRQSERKEIYQEYGRKLVEMGAGYYCFCTADRLAKVREEQQRRKESPHYDGTCRLLDPDEAAKRVATGEKHVIRFKMPREGTTTVTDHLRGDIIFENKHLDDYILMKSDGFALYHLAASIDDHLMGITHVIRGSEWLPTFSLHALIHRAFGWQEPTWCHLSVFLKPSGKGKMSKRDAVELRNDGNSFFLKDLESLGYLPNAVVNWVALMGWSFDDHSEFFTLPDLVEKFSIDKLNPAPAAINFTKFDHFNGLHIRSLSADELASRLVPYFERAGIQADRETLVKIAPIIRERMVTLDEAPELAGFFFKAEVTPEPTDLIAKGVTATQSAEAARKSYEVLATLPEITAENAEPPMRALVETLGWSLGQVFGILRVAVTGQKVSPPLFESMAIIGRDKVLARIQTAIDLLEKMV
ncbi:MAG: glutamate--tRNA ligase [Anaerolineaceae bacterium]|nr:glutamate--tRNA ligase [Anaerolineaceae bacterium]